ncbi:tRNA pseudouridine(38-40) synthase TruA [Nereida sp. NH-UV-3]|uniref:tRNA pseudouridine(38-40) synthase TruA n=1 Tax=Nereida TaxID=282198 RepID=UPI0036F374A6
MHRYALKIEYNGAPYHGWQRQVDLPSVQGMIEKAIGKVAGSAHEIAAAGRTDAGVHAWAQVAHVDMERDWDTFRLSEAINYHLKPNPIAIIGCAKVTEAFHARFSAVERRYIFRMVSRRAPIVHEAGLVWQVKPPLSLEAMQEGAKHLLGYHDFTTFRSSICQGLTPFKTLDRLDVSEHPYPGGAEFRFDVRARSFLHNQVRSFVGTLERVGAGHLEPSDVKRRLEACERSACGPVSAPHGLYLAGVGYDDDPFE